MTAAHQLALLPKASRSDYETPRSLFDPLHEEFRFTVDACALPRNAKLHRYWSPQEDGLRQDWRGHSVWCNPPFARGEIEPWIEKALGAVVDPELLTVVVQLIPANRTDVAWWHELVLPNLYRYVDIRWLRGRVRFVGAADPPKFPCCLLIWSSRSARASQHPSGRTQERPRR